VHHVRGLGKKGGKATERTSLKMAKNSEGGPANERSVLLVGCPLTVFSGSYSVRTPGEEGGEGELCFLQGRALMRRGLLPKKLLTKEPAVEDEAGQKTRCFRRAERVSAEGEWHFSKLEGFEAGGFLTARDRRGKK